MQKHFVHKYKWSHEKKRKIFKKWFKLGYVTLLGRTKDGWLYETPHNITNVYPRKKVQYPKIELNDVPAVA